jgi:hypothetical protein
MRVRQLPDAHWENKEGKHFFPESAFRNPKFI